MERSAMDAALREALSTENSHTRSWNFARVIVALDSADDVSAARDLVEGDETLMARVPENGMLNFEWELAVREKYESFEKLDAILETHPRVKARASGIAQKVALLEFAEYCSCDPEFVCKSLENLLGRWEAELCEFQIQCGYYATGKWPRNHYGSLMMAIAMFTQRPCWVFRRFFVRDFLVSANNGDTIMVQHRENAMAAVLT